MVGNNPSIFQGEGYDFIELREYMPGDDIRHIDWNITAKMRQSFIKVFREERELNVVLASVLNGSVYFGSHRFKQDVIAEIAALLGFSVVKNGDLLSSYIYTDAINSYNKPSKKHFQVQKYTSDILDFEPISKQVYFKFIADSLYKRLKRRSLIFVIGDFFELPDFKLLAKKHEVIAIIVRDKHEEHPPKMGFSSLVDPQSGASLEGDFDASSVASYTKKVLAHDRALFDTFRKHKIRFTKIYTDATVAVQLRKLFEGR
ncbi:MAG: DUF58 domain-containing protein [Campylobacterales bacterium]|nr:DUF58 domain-containing protein [Campylobacterales bacterium]